MSDVFCNRCGHRNPPAANFCSACGSALVAPHADLTLTFTSLDAAGEVHEPDVAVHIDRFTDGPGVLVIKRGPDAGAQFSLDAPRTSCGRATDSDIFLDDVTVSRTHSEFGRDSEGRYWVRDVGSLNGTYLNRERIAEARLHNGDEVQIGKFRLVFLLGTGAD